jgi:mannan endo-1,4-beta-mannosidase
VADHDVAEVEFGAGTTLPATANDVSWHVKLSPDSLDLNPGLPGQQTEFTSPDGRFELLPGGGVAFLPASGFSGTALASYVVYDAKNDVSNAATLSVVVKPDPNATLKLFSFETGTDGWAPASWQSNAGVLAQSSAFASDGTQSLHVTTADGGWFGLVLPAALDLTGRTALKFDIKTTVAGTSRNAAIQVGGGWQWCQGSWGWINPDTTETVEIDLRALDCGLTDLSVVRSLYVWFSGAGAHYLDHVRAE